MRVFQNIHNVFRNLTPYLIITAIAFLVLNYLETQKVREQISNISRDVSSLENEISSISLDYDNSDVISEIEDATYQILTEINSAESHIESTIMIWN